MIPENASDGDRTIEVVDKTISLEDEVFFREAVDAMVAELQKSGSVTLDEGRYEKLWDLALKKGTVLPRMMNEIFPKPVWLNVGQRTFFLVSDEEAKGFFKRYPTI